MNDARHDERLGQRLYAVRKKHGVSQQEFAISIGISRSAYQSYERAEREVPFFVVRNVADRYETDLLWLAFDDGDQRILSRNQGIGMRYDKILRFIDERLKALDRVTSTDKRFALAMQVEAQLYATHQDVTRTSLESDAMLNSLIVSMSEAA